MRIKVRLFAMLREKVGADELTLHLRPSTTAAAAAETLGERFPEIQRHLPSLAYAVNQEYAPATTELKEGDELALIPPVSGG